MARNDSASPFSEIARIPLAERSVRGFNESTTTSAAAAKGDVRDLRTYADALRRGGYNSRADFVAKAADRLEGKISPSSNNERGTSAPRVTLSGDEQSLVYEAAAYERAPDYVAGVLATNGLLGGSGVVNDRSNSTMDATTERQLSNVWRTREG